MRPLVNLPGERATLDPRVGRVVELKYCGGYTDKEVCDIIGENLPRVGRDWVYARSWLQGRFDASGHDA